MGCGLADNTLWFHFEPIWGQDRQTILIAINKYKGKLISVKYAAIVFYACVLFYAGEQRLLLCSGSRDDSVYAATLNARHYAYQPRTLRLRRISTECTVSQQCLNEYQQPSIETIAMLLLCIWLLSVTYKVCVHYWNMTSCDCTAAVSLWSVTLPLLPPHTLPWQHPDLNLSFCQRFGFEGKPNSFCEALLIISKYLVLFCWFIPILTFLTRFCLWPWGTAWFQMFTCCSQCKFAQHAPLLIASKIHWI